MLTRPALQIIHAFSTLGKVLDIILHDVDAFVNLSLNNESSGVAFRMGCFAVRLAAIGHAKIIWLGPMNR